MVDCYVLRLELQNIAAISLETHVVCHPFKKKLVTASGPNPDCMYLHDLGRDIDSFTKEDMAQGKHLLSNMTNVTPDGDLINPGLKHQDTFDHDTPGQKLKVCSTSFIF